MLVADYPLLPVRRRFWERVLRATDRAGSNSQLRAQLRIVLKTVQEIANDPLGRVVTGDALYEHIAPDMIQTGVLPRQVDETIRKQRDGTVEGRLRSRLCALVFLIGQLPTEAGGDTGVRPTVDVLADLMVEDLKAGGSSLRQRIPELLEGMVERGDLMRVEGEYRLQTREGAEWNLDYHSAYARILGDDARIAGDRDRELRQAATEALKGVSLVQGESKTPRKIEIHFATDAPSSNAGAVPVWVRDEWSVSEKTAREEARAAGPEDPVVHVFLHRRNADALKRAIASYEAATEVLQGRPVPTTNEGLEARAAIESRQRGARSNLDATIGAVIRSARVLQGGGAEVAEGPLRAMVQTAAETSLHRLYPQFEAGDNPRWELAFKRAREGGGDPLKAVGYSGDAEKHPVCARIVSYVGAAGKLGRDVRGEFGGPPYGWPPDTINGALVVLLAAGVLRAEINGQPAGVKDVDRTKIGVTAFRTETVVLRTPQLLKVRGLFRDAGLDVRSKEELQGAGEFLRLMEELADSAGGAAPLPAPPDKSNLQELRSLGGNELLVGLYEADDRLRADMAAWREAAKKTKDRVPRWERLRRLLDQARPLSESATLREQADAVYEGRALLEEPDPVPPLLSEVADLLRGAVTEAHRRYSEAFDAGVRGLEGSSAWRSLDEREQDRILRANNLARRGEPRLGNDAAVLDSLNGTSLSEWEDLIDALPERFARALREATEKVEPQTIRIRAPSASLRTAEEVDDYLEGLKAEILQHIDEGRPVIL